MVFFVKFLSNFCVFGAMFKEFITFGLRILGLSFFFFASAGAAALVGRLKDFRGTTASAPRHGAGFFSLEPWVSFFWDVDFDFWFLF